MASITKLPNGKYRVRYRDATKKEHTRHFDRKADGQRWADEATAAMMTGQYVDPGAGRVTFREYAEQWRAIQAHREGTSVGLESNLRLHVYPVIGDRPIGSLLPSDLKGLVAKMKASPSPLADSTVSVIYRHISAIMKSAVADRRIAASPCSQVKVAKPRKTKVSPMTTADVFAIADHIAPRYKGLILLLAGSGLRLGEALGLSIDHIDFLRGTVRVDRQLLQIAGQKPKFGPPKTEASYRTVPVPQIIIDAVAAHLAAYPPVGRDSLVFLNHLGDPVRRTSLWSIWQDAALATEVPGRTFHDLRHYYASLLIRHGESVKTVQARLGHASAVETLDTYSHLWPDSDDRTREAVEAAMAVSLADSVRTGTVGGE
jgi:integrase